MSEIRVNKVINAAGADAPNFPYGFSVAAGYGITGGGNVVGTAATFSGAVNIDATTDSTSTTTGALIVDGGLGVAKNVYIGAGLSVAGTLTYQDVTEVDSVGLITAKSGVNITGGDYTQTGGGEVKVGTAVTISSTAGVSTFSGDVIFDGATETKTITWDKSADVLIFNDSVHAKFGSDSDMAIYHDGSNGKIINNTGSLTLNATNSEAGVDIAGNGAVQLYYDGSSKLATTNNGAVITGIGTFTDGLHSAGLLRERANVVANKLSAGTNVEMIYGNVHYYTTNETTTATPNIRYNSSYSLNSKMGIGEAVTVTIIYKPNGAGYYAALTVDGSGVTEEWNGGSAPSSANSGGYDVLTHTLVKTADATFLCLSNVQNYA